MAAELEKHKFQLSQVEASLALEPENEELSNLAASLREIIAETEHYHKLSEPSAASSAPVSTDAQVRPHQFKLGDKCEALFSADNQWYPAEVQAVSKDGYVYTVLYLGYEETEIVKASGIRPMSKESLKRAAAALEEAEREQNQKKKEKKKVKSKERLQRFQAVEHEQKSKQSNWLQFAQKKTKTIPGLTQKSIFASPETPEGKVGVVGSGKGTTDFGKRKKYEFGFGPSDALPTAP